MNDDRKLGMIDRIRDAGMLVPEDITFGQHGGSIAAAFRIENVIETIEGCGATDSEMADDVVRQLRIRLQAGLNHPGFVGGQLV